MLQYDNLRAVLMFFFYIHGRLWVVISYHTINGQQFQTETLSSLETV